MIVVDEVASGDAASFHGREMPTEPAPHLWWFRPERRAVVLGSTQDSSVLDLDACRRHGLDVVARRSGGGVVVVGQELNLWLDVLVPRGHHRWDDDVARASWWIGDVWARVLESHGVRETIVHRDSMVTSPLARLVCFAGRGPGEVFVGPSKAVGISQRRTRDWARFQCALSLRWDAELHAEIVKDPSVTAHELRACGLTVSLDVERLAVDLGEEFRTELS